MNPLFAIGYIVFVRPFRRISRYEQARIREGFWGNMALRIGRVSLPRRYGYIWCLRRWHRRRNIKVDYPGFREAVLKRRAW